MQANKLFKLLYSAFWWLVLPVCGMRLLWKSIKQPAYRVRWQERFGGEPNLNPDFDMTVWQSAIWIHAVSVGESMAVMPLVKKILSSQINQKIIFTNTTPTGSACVQRILSAELNRRVLNVYLPFDWSVGVNCFLTRFRPRIGLIVESELWPNLLSCAKKLGVQLALINACLSPTSFKRYLILRCFGIPQNILNYFDWIGVQSELQYNQFIALGADPNKTEILGNLKFDIFPNTAQKNTQAKLKIQFADRWVWVAGSTHAGEEQIILSVFQNLKKNHPELSKNILLILAPRHPERFNQVGSLIQSMTPNWVRGSAYSKRLDKIPAQTEIYLLDQLGQLNTWYSIAKLSFVGGTLVPIGGHNLIEPAVWGSAIIAGPYLFKCESVKQLLLAAQALIIESDLLLLTRIILDLLEHPDRLDRLGQAAYRAVLVHQGASDRMLKKLQHFK